MEVTVIRDKETKEEKVAIINLLGKGYIVTSDDLEVLFVGPNQTGSSLQFLKQPQQ